MIDGHGDGRAKGKLFENRKRKVVINEKMTSFLRSSSKENDPKVKVEGVELLRKKHGEEVLVGNVLLGFE